MSEPRKITIVPMAVQSGVEVSQVFIWDATQEEVHKWLQQATTRFFLFQVMGEKGTEGVPLIVNTDYIINVAKEIPVEPIAKLFAVSPEKLPKPSREMN